jgi:predicted lipase
MKYRDMGWVHSGFAKAYEEIRDLQDTVIKKDKPLVVSGHSLGGATATVAALDLKQRGYDVHSVYTYGSPRVGYSDFKEIYEGAKIPTYRFVNAYDVVPRIPKINYHHVGEPYFLTTDGKIQDRQQSAWNLWPWQVPQQRVESHHLPNYMANLQKYIA